jgi:bifunctional DNA-binding transcriptional regulator/antitoxin component of YhaV-PrlF toxin-antitoxin module
MVAEIMSNEEGRLTIPADVRAALHVEGAAQWTAEVVNGALVLRPAVLVPREDVFLYTPEERAKREQAREQARAGRSYANVRPDDLEDLMAGRVTMEDLEARLVARRAAGADAADTTHA